jgi:hypothetical protein
LLVCSQLFQRLVLGLKYLAVRSLFSPNKKPALRLAWLLTKSVDKLNNTILKSHRAIKADDKEKD